MNRNDVMYILVVRKRYKDRLKKAKEEIEKSSNLIEWAFDDRLESPVGLEMVIDCLDDILDTLMIDEKKGDE